MHVPTDRKLLEFSKRLILLIILYAITLVTYAQEPSAKPLTNADVVGANPDDFEAVIIKISPTNNWRLIGAQKTKAKYFESGKRTELNFIEDKIANKLTKLGRGHLQIEAQQTLAENEYRIVLRTISKSQKVSLKDTLYRQGEGVLLGIV